MEGTTFLCSCCGEVHQGPALRWHRRAPDAWLAIPEADRAGRGVLGSDLCILDGQHFMIFGLIEIPVLDGDGPFGWGVWVSLSRENIERAVRLADDPLRIQEPPYFGWLCNKLPGYPETTNLKTRVHTREVGTRPLIELEPTDHPLAVEQRTGITSARVREIAEQMLHQR